MSDTTSGPALSVVLPAPERISLVLRTVAAIAAQTVADRIEMVIVARDASEAIPSELTASLRWVQVVPRPDWTTMTAARVHGILQSRAPVVALAEDHCFPARGWAEALLAAHREPWAAVGPAFVNANPATLVSWANFAIEYGPWLAPVTAGATDHVPGHNSSYKRAILLEYGDRLEAMLEAESVLHWDLHSRGLKVAMEPAAVTRHENFSRLAPSLQLRLYAGRLFAGCRAKDWPVWRRLSYAAASPAIPLVRAWRTRRHLARVPAARSRRGLMPAILALLAVDAFGEFVGYLLGTGDLSQRLSEIEHDRPRFMSDADRRAAS